MSNVRNPRACRARSFSAVVLHDRAMPERRLRLAGGEMQTVPASHWSMSAGQLTGGLLAAGLFFVFGWQDISPAM
jgi:hypothetical protein